ncbi:ribonuclease H-like domain-containing protein [Schnuerera sp.]|uniref:ribonuclease H-like domain-containing protein n=1 Tax=Schnuerera sp. TaxID=2794844 RepID=UPI002CE860D5|nr:ribonuclease H-like domain-containing protein [Schnuerera sp.]HSH36204.1 ribonuclease H-like domain-containing protein [Schnuerera sp.]
MEIYEDSLVNKNFIFDYFDKNRACFLDIETTGLSRKYNHIYLIGLVYFNIQQNKWYLKQFFANNIKEEKDLLKEFNSFIKNFNLIITYNGDSFDLPFIKYRLEKFNINNNMINVESFDIYRKIRANSAFLNFKNLRLKTIEENLGIYREDEYSGKDCINFYHQYMNREDNILKEKILKHNYDDLYYLVDILKIFDVIKNIKTIFINYNGKNLNVCIEDIIIVGDVFKIICNTSSIDEEINIIYYQDTYNINWQSESIIIDLEIKEGFITPTKKALFLDKANLPSNIQLTDLSQYMVPDDIILLKVENKYIVENIKNIIQKLLNKVKE